MTNSIEQTDPSNSSEPNEAASELESTRKARMRQRLLDRASNQMTVARANEQRWRKFLPGVAVKVLHVDAGKGVQMALWKMDPGAHIPAHPHGEDEECYVLEGNVEHRGERFQAGDYMLAPAGSRHGRIHSPDGVIMLIRGEALSWSDRLLLRTAMAMGR